MTEEVITEVRLGDEVDTRQAIAAAKDAFDSFRHSTPAERIEILCHIKDSIIRHAEELSQSMIDEYGGVPKFAPFCVQTMVQDIDTMCNVIRGFDFERTLGHSRVLMQPVGVVGEIIPWNACNIFISTKTCAAIAAGCSCVIKLAELSSRQAYVMMKVFDDAKIPKGLVNIVLGKGTVVGNELTSNSDVSKITFTGSTAVGKGIMKSAADTMKRVTLELGGKSPTVILEDADLESALTGALSLGFLNNGQACIAGTRILVHKSQLQKANDLIKKLVPKYFIVGDPHNSLTTIGPEVDRKQWERVQEYIRIGIDEGATLLVGGLGRPDGLERGYYSKATVFTDVRNDMRIAQEEIFGPVLCVIPYEDDADAIRIANDTPYGLAAYIFGSKERAERIAQQIDAGQITINGAAHDPAAPFGGFKQSGVGREYGMFGLQAYLEPKAIVE